MRIYISGCMTGCPYHNRPAFDAAAKRLREHGHFVINPAELSAMFGSEEDVAESFNQLYLEESVDWHCCTPHPTPSQMRIAHAIMSADLAAVRSCDAIYLLRGWETSRGAKRELAEAIAHGLTVMQEEDEK